MLIASTRESSLVTVCTSVLVRNLAATMEELAWYLYHPGCIFIMTAVLAL